MKCVNTYLYTFSSFNIGTLYIRMLTVITNIYLSHTSYITNVLKCGAKVKT